MKKLTLGMAIFTFISCQKNVEYPTNTTSNILTEKNEANIPPTPSLNEGEVYFSSGNNIYRMSNTALEENNQEPELIYQNLGKSKIEDISMDIYLNKIFWSDSQNDKIFYANADGTNAKFWSIKNPGRITIDPIKRKLYWISAKEDAYFIYRANLDGTFKEGFLQFNQDSKEPVLDIEIPTGSNEIFITTALRTCKVDLETKAVKMNTFKAAGYMLDVSGKNTGNIIFLNQGQYIYTMDAEGKNPLNILSDNKYFNEGGIAFDDKKKILYCASAEPHHPLQRVNIQGDIIKKYETYPIDGAMIVVNKN